jgi:hypothetical protein
MGNACGSAETLFCLECVCVTWQSLVGLGLPLCVAVVYLKRVLREATVNDWLLMLLLSVFTWGTKKVTEQGVSHEPWYLYAVAMWAIVAQLTERVRSLPSIPMVWFMSFACLCLADVASMIYNRPEGMYGVPGGRGIMDGLIIKPLIAGMLMWGAYALKVWPIAPNKHRRGKVYDAESRDYLMNLSPWYRRADTWDKTLTLVPARASETVGAEGQRVG